MDKLQLAILKALAYADVFDYPLNSEELYRFLIADKPLSQSSFRGALTLINTDSKQINTDGKYYFLKGREKMVEIRKKREKWSREKLRKALRVTGWLKTIPWVKLVGVTGGLAIANSGEADDIDILIVCSKGRLWLTRLASVLLLEALGKRRRPGDREVRDKICLNMFLDEAHLGVPKRERDLFSAHEVSQIKILWDTGEGSGQKFFSENRWINQYLPNAINLKVGYQQQKWKNNQSKVLDVLERLAQRFQLWYMRKRRTTEVISDGIIRFHPQDARTWVLKAYGERLQKLGLDNS